jgi:hypothetical protein
MERSRPEVSVISLYLFYRTVGALRNSMAAKVARVHVRVKVICIRT